MVTDFNPALAAACSILRCNLPRFTGKFQSSNSEHNFYLPSENLEWTTGFCTGEYWLAWEHTHEAAGRKLAAGAAAVPWQQHPDPETAKADGGLPCRTRRISGKCLP